MKRRDAIKTLGALTAVPATAATAHGAGDPPDTAGTPLQFMPRTPPDANPLDEELAKYPRCPYCGMDRTQWHHSRHLVHYSDGRADGTCSIHCLAISLSLNLDRGPVAIYAADYGADRRIKPMIEVEGATYLIGSRLKGTMTRTSKMAFADEKAAKAAQERSGGELGDFDDALRRAYLDMAEDTRMIRNKRAERRRRRAEGAPGEAQP